jgi:hypothetical protein
MNRIAPIKLSFEYEEKDNSERSAKAVYARIFELAWKRMTLDAKSTQEYTIPNGQQRGVFDTGGSSGEAKSKEDNNIQNVPIRENSSRKVRKSMENKRQSDKSVIAGQGGSQWINNRG